ncbi:hypothetical protein TrVE_jg12288 [Triparma verrucosa]|uniref:J domain-containing protein n=1 Tax=Triparma verrucosa TaxID=1606542 RepID=A0A9W7BJK8_9STRA|nr:hypothetical protein TrVE_jg12288 [Triparma verrucosa]
MPSLRPYLLIPVALLLSVSLPAVPSVSAQKTSFAANKVVFEANVEGYGDILIFYGEEPFDVVEKFSAFHGIDANGQAELFSQVCSLHPCIRHRPRTPLFTFTAHPPDSLPIPITFYDTDSVDQTAIYICGKIPKCFPPPDPDQPSNTLVVAADRKISPIETSLREELTRRLKIHQTTQIRSPCLYTRLSLGTTLSDSTPIQISSAYRSLSLVHHPDRGGEAEHFQLLSEAYKTLTNEKTKLEYDVEHGYVDPPNPFDGKEGRPYVSPGFGGLDVHFDPSTGTTTIRF